MFINDLTIVLFFRPQANHALTLQLMQGKGSCHDFINHQVRHNPMSTYTTYTVYGHQKDSFVYSLLLCSHMASYMCDVFSFRAPLTCFNLITFAQRPSHHAVL